MPYGHLTRHVRLHYDFSEEFNFLVKNIKGDFPQIYKLKEGHTGIIPRQYDWISDILSFRKDDYLLYGLKSWLGLPTWKMAMLDNSRRGMVLL